MEERSLKESTTFRGVKLICLCAKRMRERQPNRASIGAYRKT